MDALAMILVVGSAVILLVAAVYLVNFVTSSQPISLKGKHFMVVGGSSGIGLAMAQQAAAQGASVSVVARSPTKLAEAQALLEKEAERARSVRGPVAPAAVCSVAADASSLDDMRLAVAEATAKCGPVQVLVCCQGVCRPHAFQDWAVAGMREHMEANFWGTVHALKAGALEDVKTASPAGEGRVLFVSSQAGQCGLYGYTAYSASKFALRGLAESLRQELIPFGVKVGLLFPPDTDTPQLHEESKTKTAITKILTASSGAPLPAAAVAAAGLEGLKRGHFLISANFSGFMLNVATAGMAPAASVGAFVVEVLLAPLMRIVAVLTLADFEKVIRANFGREDKGAKQQ